MSEEYGLVEFSLPKPGCFLCCKEDLDSHILSSPLCLPHLTISTFTNRLLKMNLLCYRPLDLQIQNSLNHINMHVYEYSFKSSLAFLVLPRHGIRWFFGWGFFPYQSWLQFYSLPYTNFYSFPIQRVII